MFFYPRLNELNYNYDLIYYIFNNKYPYSILIDETNKFDYVFKLDHADIKPSVVFNNIIYLIFLLILINILIIKYIYYFKKKQ